MRPRPWSTVPSRPRRKHLQPDVSIRHHLEPRLDVRLVIGNRLAAGGDPPPPLKPGMRASAAW